MVTKKIFKIPIYCFKITVYIYSDEKEIPEFIHGFRGRVGYMTYWDDKPEIIISIHEESGCGAICHEVNHAKNFIFKFIGQKTDIDNDECESYLVQWLASTISSVWHKHKYKKKGSS